MTVLSTLPTSFFSPVFSKIPRPYPLKELVRVTVSFLGSSFLGSSFFLPKPNRLRLKDDDLVFDNNDNDDNDDDLNDNIVTINDNNNNIINAIINNNKNNKRND